jgi:diguanylate cyclase (GGDEF)-like protein
MRTESLIALKLAGQTASPVTAALLPVLDRAFVLIGHVLLAVEDESQRLEMTARLREFRAALDSVSAPEEMSALTASCFDICEHAIQMLQGQQSERRAELRRLVMLVRETVSVLVGDGRMFSSDIEKAADRFHSLLWINDVQQLKQRLMVEVNALQRVAVERQHQWQEAVETFEVRIESLEKQLVAVKQEAALDPLTGIANRRSFEQSVREALQAPQRELIVAVLDLDDFKLVNDRGGHEAGDAVLQAVAQTLRRSVRRNDIVARIGGDEFALLGMAATMREAEPRIRSIIAELGALPTGLAAPAVISASCGLAEYCAGDTLESLMRRADQALYDAKRLGKHRLVTKSPPFIRDLLHRKH